MFDEAHPSVLLSPLSSPPTCSLLGPCLLLDGCECYEPTNTNNIDQSLTSTKVRHSLRTI